MAAVFSAFVTCVLVTFMTLGTRTTTLVVHGVLGTEWADMLEEAVTMGRASSGLEIEKLL